MSNRIYVATRKGLFTLERSAARRATPWHIARLDFPAVPVSIVLDDQRDDSVYAALGHGHYGVKLHRSRDRGLNWSECQTPTFPPRPEGAPADLCPARNIPIPWNTELIWAMETGGMSENGVLWCGTVPGALFRSTDHGDSWTFVQSLWDRPERRQWFGGGMDYPGIHSICVDPRNPRRVLVGVSCGGVWLTEDAGNTWQCRADGMYAAYMPPEQKFNPAIQDPHRMVACHSDPDTLWVQHHNGVFHSADGAKSWHDVPAAVPSTFGFAVAVHPHDPRTAWFVPAKSDEQRLPIDGQVVVSRTRDAGQSFEVLRQGLPQEHAYDITYRHALDVDESGDRLAFGTTTGSLWISEDQGDQWSAVSNNLPPVYCVRFA